MRRIAALSAEIRSRRASTSRPASVVSCKSSSFPEPDPVPGPNRSSIAPLRRADRPARPRDRQCTNTGIEPVTGDRSRNSCAWVRREATVRGLPQIETSLFFHPKISYGCVSVASMNVRGQCDLQWRRGIPIGGRRSSGNRVRLQGKFVEPKRWSQFQLASVSPWQSEVLHSGFGFALARIEFHESRIADLQMQTSARYGDGEKRAFGVEAFDSFGVHGCSHWSCSGSLTPARKHST